MNQDHIGMRTILELGWLRKKLKRNEVTTYTNNIHIFSVAQ